jgi:hypothetical protein
MLLLNKLLMLTSIQLLLQVADLVHVVCNFYYPMSCAGRLLVLLHCQCYCCHLPLLLLQLLLLLHNHNMP